MSVLNVLNIEKTQLWWAGLPTTGVRPQLSGPRGAGAGA